MNKKIILMYTVYDRKVLRGQQTTANEKTIKNFCKKTLKKLKVTKVTQ